MICPHCGKGFEPTGGHKFCSKTCWALAKNGLPADEQLCTCNWPAPFVKRYKGGLRLCRLCLKFMDMRRKVARRMRTQPPPGWDTAGPHHPQM